MKQQSEVSSIQVDPTQTSLQTYSEIIPASAPLSRINFARGAGAASDTLIFDLLRSFRTCWSGMLRSVCFSFFLRSFSPWGVRMWSMPGLKGGLFAGSRTPLMTRAVFRSELLGNVLFVFLVLSTLLI